MKKKHVSFARPLFPLVLLAAALIALALTRPIRAADARVVKTIRVLHQNIYGRTERDCETRYKALADHILAANPPFDIVSLNEHWRGIGTGFVNCDAKVFTRRLQSTGLYKNGGGVTRQLTSFPDIEEFPQVRGGLSVFSLHPMTEYLDFRFTGTRDFPVYGALLTRIEVASGVVLDHWNTHLEAVVDGCDEFCRLEEIDDLSGWVSVYSSPDHPGQGNPVLLTGDFNIGGPGSMPERVLHRRDPQRFKYAGNAGYEDLIDYFKKPLDLWLKLHPLPLRDLGGVGWTIDGPTNTIEEGTSRERIDYMFVPTHKDFVDSRYELRPRSTEVVRWKTPAGEHVSDHYGLDSTLDIVVK